jgi:alkylated DNA repair dioxygenase AlkB
MEIEKIVLKDGWIRFIPTFLNEDFANQLFEHLQQTIQWQQGEIVLFGKKYATPRLEAFYADNQKSYGYSGQRLITHEFTKELNEIRQKLTLEIGTSFNSVLLNLYRTGNDSNGWHADNEPELGKNPIIASLSLGATRRFDLKHNTTKEQLSFHLNHGSLLIMGGELQHHWKHQIAKTKKVNEPRINLTFRNIQ